MSEFWDKEAIYDEKISPLMREIIAICKEHSIPLVAQFQYANDEEKGPLFCTTSLPIVGVACDKIKRLAEMAKPQHPVCIAETHETMPDGSKRITIRQV